MTIKSEHIGKKVTSKGAPLGNFYTVLAVDDDLCWLKSETGSRAVFKCEDSWRLIEDPKRPSELIVERTGQSRHTWTLVEQAIIKILDEQWEKRNC